MINVKKIGFVCKPENFAHWWKTHAMAPAPLLLNKDVIRIYCGGWDENGISRIGFIDVSVNNPQNVLDVSQHPVLDIGRDGCFDENGVFPGHVYDMGGGKIHLYYTGFQLGHKIRHYNFGGLAVSNDSGNTFQRYSEAPIMDRADEGLFVRAGQSIETANEGGFHMVYSAGSDWQVCMNELRPVYDVFYQHSADGIASQDVGKRIVACDREIEHGLGRPQIIKLKEKYFVFYTRRIIKNMKYFIGGAVSENGIDWLRIDNDFDSVEFGRNGDFDNEMIYFPAVVKISDSVAYLFYSGNYFGKDGIGLLELSL